ncbi:ABC transporter permease [Roseibium alexandrii]|uniref:Amine acid ABC transporter, permease protein, 3-TM region, His/Glu/Gln/Arg/opine family n=1 Tax=Roseibium alexandrii (strain DSM 17067 / NCIMB 14079 / DFL-11) TaxID=244592 RepID=A0A5E8GUJ6_ROSAD|nr:ABC transporter permease subunit [Roseibium alexandrii]EEE43568.1 amine acid ABC transporter, permease protein, 3-TM region, His/Glu/Gln/Arg/opine family [Roseibium alexandrii DFL-11]
MNEALTLLSFGEQGWGDTIASGVLITVSLALATLPIGLILGFLIALAKKSSEPSLKLAANIYTTIFRGLPELLTLFLVYFGVQIAIQEFIKLLGYDIYFEVNSFVAGMVALSLVFSSYASEAFLSAFNGIPQGQYEGGYALGLSRYKTMRFIILPQLIRLALPALGNLWLILLKETSLVSVIGLADLVREAGIAARVTKEPFLFFGLVLVIYLLLTMISSVGLLRIERWSKRGDAAR